MTRQDRRRIATGTPVATRPSPAAGLHRVGGGLLLILIAALAACSNEKAEPAKGKGSPAQVAVPVLMGTAASKAVPVQVRAVGTVQAYAAVTLKSQLDAQVAEVHITEGQAVKQGDLLFTLDRRPWEAVLSQAEAILTKDVAQLQQAEAQVAQAMAAEKQAEANLARDTAQLENARSQARRYRALLDEGAISKELHDNVQTTATALEATIQADQAAIANARASVRATQATMENVKAAIKADQAAIENVRVQLSYTVIRAPMDARAGNLLVRAGSAVKARDDTAQMLVLNQIQPIYVSYSVPEQHLGDIKKYLAAKTVRVEVTPRGQEGPPLVGELTFMNNTVDASTGTIQLKATFPNREGRLWPGQFADVVMTLTVQPDRVVIPSEAIQTGQQGQYVYLLRGDSTVELRPVRVGRRIDGETVVDEGIAPGDRVVTDGHLRLTSGSRVQVKGGEAAAPGKAQ